MRLAAELDGPSHRAVRVAVDDPASIDALAASIEADHGRLDVLVNCAGVTQPVAHDDLDGLTDETIDRIFAHQLARDPSPSSGRSGPPSISRSIR